MLGAIPVVPPRQDGIAGRNGTRRIPVLDPHDCHPEPVTLDREYRGLRLAGRGRRPSRLWIFQRAKPDVDSRREFLVRLLGYLWSCNYERAVPVDIRCGDSRMKVLDRTPNFRRRGQTVARGLRGAERYDEG